MQTERNNNTKGELAEILKELKDLKTKVATLEGVTSIQHYPTAHTEGGGVEDVMPPTTSITPQGGATLRTLQQTASLQNETLNRFAELFEDSDDEDQTDRKRSSLLRGKKSGRVRTADDRVLKEIAWPHFYVYKAGSAESVKYNELSVADFVFGYCSQLLEEGNTKEWRKKIEHLKTLMQDTSDYSWDSARNFHGVLLSMFERKRLTWQDTMEIADLRVRFAQRKEGGQAIKARGKTVASPTPASRKQVGRRCCRSYNMKSCPEEDDHVNSNGDMLVHCCSFCWRAVKKERRHSEAECHTRKKTIRQGIMEEKKQ